MRRRLIRLHPVYFIGSLIAVTEFLVAMLRGSRNVFESYASLFRSIALHILILPTPVFGFKDPLFPINSPSWSILLELFANLIYAYFAGYLSIRLLYVCITLTVSFLIGSAFYFGSLDLGADWLTLAGGAARVLGEFSIGVLISRVSPERLRVPTWCPGRYQSRC